MAPLRRSRARVSTWPRQGPSRPIRGRLLIVGSRRRDSIPGCRIRSRESCEREFDANRGICRRPIQTFKIFHNTVERFLDLSDTSIPFPSIDSFVCRKHIQKLLRRHKLRGPARPTARRSISEAPIARDSCRCQIMRTEKEQSHAVHVLCEASHPGRASFRR